MSDTSPATSALIAITDESNQTRLVVFEVRLDETDPNSPRVWMYITASKLTGEIICAARKVPPTM